MLWLEKKCDLSDQNKIEIEERKYLSYWLSYRLLLLLLQLFQGIVCILRTKLKSGLANADVKSKCVMCQNEYRAAIIQETAFSYQSSAYLNIKAYFPTGFKRCG